MIRAEQVEKVYENGTPALRDINLTIQPGEFVFLVGESGAGKTTLLKLLLGMETITGGRLTVNGLSLREATPGQIRQLRREIGGVFQDFKLIPGRTALENVAISLRVLGVSNRFLSDKALAALSEVGLAEKAGCLIDSLSWGERQRVAFARAVAREPLLLIADEPTGNLDAGTATLIDGVLQRAHGKGATVVVVTHDMRMVQDLQKRVIVLSRGRIVSDSAWPAKQAAVSGGRI